MSPAREPARSAAELRVVRRDRVTLTQSCAEALEEAIELGMYRPGGRLPSEAELAEKLAVSRPTLREALRLLEERGTIRRHHGRGTFVCERPPHEALNRNFGITSMIRAAGCEPSTRHGRVVPIMADADLAERLGLTPGDPLWQIERLRLADDRPIVFSIDSLPSYLVAPADLDALVSGKEQSLYHLLYERRGVAVHRGEAEFLPCRASAELPGLLQVKSGTALLCMRQVDFDQHGSAIVYSVDYHVPDWVTFKLERVGPGSATSEI